MEVKTTFRNREQFGMQLGKAITNFEQIYSKSDLVLSEKLYPMKRESYHFIGQMLKKLSKATRTEQAVATEIFKAVYQAEVSSAGAGNIAFLFAVEFARNLHRSAIQLKNETELMNAYRVYMERFREQLSKHSKIATPDDVQSVIQKSCEDALLAEVIWQAVQLGGLEGRIFVENGRQENYLVELKEGYTFHLKPFSWMLENNHWERSECKVLVIDGLVEKVSELDQVLSKAFELKQPLALVALGFSEEVVATLKANMDRGLLDIQPIRVPSDLESLNITNDIAITAGTLPISSMKGDLITFVKWEEIPTVDKVRLTADKMVIENSRTRAAVSEQIKGLLEKRQENYLYEDLQLIFDKRIRSLVSSAVSIFLPDMTAAKNDAQRVQIDISLRQCKTILNYGTTDFYSAADATPAQEDLDKIIYKSLKAINLPDRCPPTLSAVMGCMLAGRAVLQLYTAAGFVEIIS